MCHARRLPFPPTTISTQELRIAGRLAPADTAPLFFFLLHQAPSLNAILAVRSVRGYRLRPENVTLLLVAAGGSSTPPLPLPPPRCPVEAVDAAVVRRALSLLLPLPPSSQSPLPVVYRANAKFSILYFSVYVRLYALPTVACVFTRVLARTWQRVRPRSFQPDRHPPVPQPRPPGHSRAPRHREHARRLPGGMTLLAVRRVLAFTLLIRRPYLSRSPSFSSPGLRHCLDPLLARWSPPGILASFPAPESSPGIFAAEGRAFARDSEPNR